MPGLDGLESSRACDSIGRRRRNGPQRVLSMIYIYLHAICRDTYQYIYIYILYMPRHTMILYEELMLNSPMGSDFVRAIHLVLSPGHVRGMVSRVRVRVESTCAKIGVWTPNMFGFPFGFPSNHPKKKAPQTETQLWLVRSWLQTCCDSSVVGCMGQGRLTPGPRFLHRILPKPKSAISERATFTSPW